MLPSQMTPSQRKAFGVEATQEQPPVKVQKPDSSGTIGMDRLIIERQALNSRLEQLQATGVSKGDPEFIKLNDAKNAIDSDIYSSGTKNSAWLKASKAYKNANSVYSDEMDKISSPLTLQLKNNAPSPGRDINPQKTIDAVTNAVKTNDFDGMRKLQSIMGPDNFPIVRRHVVENLLAEGGFDPKTFRSSYNSINKDMRKIVFGPNSDKMANAIADTLPIISPEIAAAEGNTQMSMGAQPNASFAKRLIWGKLVGRMYREPAVQKAIINSYKYGRPSSVITSLARQVINEESERNSDKGLLDTSHAMENGLQ